MSIDCAVTGTSCCCQMPFLLYPFCIAKILQSNKINRTHIQETVYYEVWTDMIMWPRRPKICRLPPADRGKPRGRRITGLMVWTLVWSQGLRSRNTEWKKMDGPARAIRQLFHPSWASCFYAGLSWIECPLTLGRIIFFTQSTKSNINFRENAS